LAQHADCHDRLLGAGVVQARWPWALIRLALSSAAIVCRALEVSTVILLSQSCQMLAPGD
jgi:hypothetical protein